MSWFANSDYKPNGNKSNEQRNVMAGIASNLLNEVTIIDTHTEFNEVEIDKSGVVTLHRHER